MYTQAQSIFRDPVNSTYPVRLARLTPLNKPIKNQRGTYHPCLKCSTSFIVPWHALRIWMAHLAEFVPGYEFRRLRPSEDWHTLARGRSKRRETFINQLRRSRLGELVYAADCDPGLDPPEPFEFWMSRGFCRFLIAHFLRHPKPDFEILYQSFEQHLPLWASASAMHGILLPPAQTGPTGRGLQLRRASGGYVLEALATDRCC